MEERSCSERECGKQARTRGLCNQHYLKARRRGELPLLDSQARPHRITNPDLSRAIGHCAVCGPETPIRIRVGRGHECRIRRQQDSKKRNRRGSLARRYSLTLADIEQMTRDQGGRCAICQQPAKKLVVDHDHACCSKARTSCGRCVRGLLCSRCNVALGYWRDDPQLAIAAAEYLLK